MATSVKVAIPQLDIENTGVKFIRKLNGNRHGSITVRQNYIDWQPSGFEHTYTISWTALAKFAETEGEKRKPRSKVLGTRKKLTKAAGA